MAILGAAVRSYEEKEEWQQARQGRGGHCTEAVDRGLTPRVLGSCFCKQTGPIFMENPIRTMKKYRVLRSMNDDGTTGTAGEYVNQPGKGFGSPRLKFGEFVQFGAFRLSIDP